MNQSNLTYIVYKNGAQLTYGAQAAKGLVDKFRLSLALVCGNMLPIGDTRIALPIVVVLV